MSSSLLNSSGKNHPFCGELKEREEVFERDKSVRADAVKEDERHSEEENTVINVKKLKIEHKNASVRLGLTGEIARPEARSLRVTQANVLKNFRLGRSVNGREVLRAPNVSVRVQETKREAPRGANVPGDVRVGAESVAGDIARAEGGRESRSVDGVEEEEEDGAVD